MPALSRILESVSTTPSIVDGGLPTLNICTPSKLRPPERNHTTLVPVLEPDSGLCCRGRISGGRIHGTAGHRGGPHTLCSYVQGARIEPRFLQHRGRSYLTP